MGVHCLTLGMKLVVMLAHHYFIVTFHTYYVIFTLESLKVGSKILITLPPFPPVPNPQQLLICLLIGLSSVVFWGSAFYRNTTLPITVPGLPMPV